MDHQQQHHHHHPTSYQNSKSQSMALPSGAEEFVSLKCDDEILVSTGDGKSGASTAARRLKIPMIVALSLWLVVITVELSPLLLIVGDDTEQSSLGGGFQDDDTDNGNDNDNDNEQKDDDDDRFEVLLGSASFAEIVFGIRPCSIEECASSPCDNTEHTRFSCLSLQHNTRVRGGCGATPWTNQICADQCDASGCARLLQTPITAANSNGSNKVDHCNVKCPKQWCERRRLCGTETVSYQCMVGASMYGCSADKYEWTVRSNESDCSACCNTTSCS
mmetsp:Transcript_4401/g.10018  ORF Transcript_4401/g.10018 Transcript_4401/m.10018 type:complete len:276 (+) Transcript_4401:531-1358(+)